MTAPPPITTTHTVIPPIPVTGQTPTPAAIESRTPTPPALPRRRPSLGPFGIFCILALIVLSIINFTIACYLDPDWFDNLAFWRGRIYPHDVYDPSLLHVSNDPLTAPALPLFTDVAGDPFAGDWSGVIHLQSGSLAQTGIGVLDTWVALMDQRAAQLAMLDPNQDQRNAIAAKYEHEKSAVLLPIISSLRYGLTAAEAVMRTVGIRMQFSLQPDPQIPSCYLLHITKIYMIDTSRLPAISVRRIGQCTLGLPFFYEKWNLQPLLFRLHRINDVRDLYVFDEPVSGQSIGCTLHWDFQRSATVTPPATTLP
jgi:hypothetical protein